MKKLSLLSLALIATTALWASNVITYTATSKLPEITDISPSSVGLYVYAFNVSITSHEFADYIGTITFSGEVTSIGSRAFCGCPITSVNIPNSVISIGDEAFSHCTSLTTITIPNSVTSIGSKVFRNCSSFNYISIGSGISSIEKNTFDGCDSLSFIDVNASNTHYASLDGVLFNYAKDTLILYPMGNTRTEYSIPNSVTNIGDRIFSNCSFLTTINIPSSVTRISAYAFITCPLSYINVDASNPQYSSVDGVLFTNNKDTLISYPIGNNRTEYAIPNTVTRIENVSFYFCNKLTSIIVPNSVSSMGWNVFYGCTSSLTSFTCYAVNPPTCEEECFVEDGESLSTPLYVPAESVNAYKNADEWKNFTNIQAIATPLDQLTDSPAHRFTKILKDGHLLILHDGKTYNAQGGEIK